MTRHELSKQIQVGDRVRFLSGDGPDNRGVVLELRPNDTWGASPLIRWDSGDVAGIARIGDLTRDWRCALT